MARPRFELTENHLRQIKALAGYGLTMPQVAAVIDVPERTLRRRKKDSEIVLAAFEKGKAVAASRIGSSLFERATTGDVTAIIWYEKSRLGYTDKIENRHSGEVKHKHVDERNQRYNDLLGKLDAYRVGFDDGHREGTPTEPVHPGSPNRSAAKVP